MSKRRGLGRGFEALLGDAKQVKTITEVSATEQDRLKDLPVDAVTRGQYQPRRHFDEAALQELAASIKTQGVLQPIVVRQQGGSYEIIAGERRWRAAQLAGLDQIPAIIRELDDETTAAVALIENIQREDLNPLEEAVALQRLLDEFVMTHQQAADVVGRSRAAVSNLLRLLELADSVKNSLAQGQIDMGHARALLGLSTTDQVELAQQIIKQKWSVRETERQVKKRLNPAPVSTAKPDADVRRLEQTLADALSTPVTIKHKSSGKGVLSIQYSSLDNLDQVMRRLGIEAE